MAKFEKTIEVLGAIGGLEHTILQSWGQRSDQLSYYRERTQQQAEVLDHDAAFRRRFINDCSELSFYLPEDDCTPKTSSSSQITYLSLHICSLVKGSPGGNPWSKSIMTHRKVRIRAMNTWFNLESSLATNLRNIQAALFLSLGILNLL